MNIYELETRAAAAPWKCVSSDIKDQRSLDISIYSSSKVNGNPVWIGRVYGQGVLSYDIEARNANARLLVHFRNNFMTALKALKKCEAELDGEFPRSDDRHPEISGLSELIKKLEEVEA